MLDAYFNALGDATGLAPDYIKLFAMLLVAYPLAYPLPYLSANAKHLANVGVSFCFLALVLNLWYGYAQLLASCLVTYALTRYDVAGENTAWVVFGLTMGHLTINHLVRELGEIPLTTIEITAAQMVLVMNLTSFAWSCHDGRHRGVGELDEQQRSMRVTPHEFPSLLEFLGYASYFPGVLIGPSTRFTDYRKWATGELYLAPHARDAPTAPKKPSSSSSSSSSSSWLASLAEPPGASPPAGRVRVALRELASGLLFMAAWSWLASLVDYGQLSLGDPVVDGVVASSPAHPRSVRSSPLWVRVWVCQLCGVQARLKYYGIWTLTNGACALSGLSYNGVRERPRPAAAAAHVEKRDGAAGAAALPSPPPPPPPSEQQADETRWDRCRNVDVLGIEFANNWKELLDSWNINTNVWLRNNVYKRVARRGRKPGFKSTMATFVTSAFWHGVSPGYYLTFVLGGLLQSCGRTLRRHLRPFFFADSREPNPSPSTLLSGRYTPAQLAYCSLSVASVQLTVNFAALPFLMLTLRDSFRGWSSLYFYGVVLAVAPGLAMRAGLGRWLDGRSGAARRRRLAKSARSAAEALEHTSRAAAEARASSSAASRAATAAASGGDGSAATRLRSKSTEPAAEAGRASGGSSADASEDGCAVAEGAGAAGGGAGNPQVLDVDAAEREALRAAERVAREIGVEVAELARWAKSQ